MVVTAPNEAREPREVHVEDLVGRPVRDRDGRKIGRLEEIIVELEGSEWLLVQVHVGTAGLLERIVALSSFVPWVSALGGRFNRRYSIPWNDLDLSDPDHPHTFVRHGDLKRLAD